MKKFLFISLLAVVLQGPAEARVVENGRHHKKSECSRSTKTKRIKGNLHVKGNITTDNLKVKDRLCVQGRTTLNDVEIKGDLKTKKWIIPLSDNLKNPPDGSALVFTNVEESDAIPPLPVGQFPVTLDFGPNNINHVTVTQVGSTVLVALGDGIPSENLFWRQDTDYFSAEAFPTNAYLVIDFSRTPVADLFKGNGNNTMILTVPFGFDTALYSNVGVAQIGAQSTPWLKMWPASQPSFFSTATLDENGAVTIPAAFGVQHDPRITNIQVSFTTGVVPLGVPYISNINDFVDFTIKSSAGADDAGKEVFWNVQGPIQWYFRGWPDGTNAIPCFTSVVAEL